MKNKNDAVASWYVTAYLDVLGIRESLGDVPDLPGPLSADQMRNCTASIFRSYEVVMTVRDGIEHHVKTFAETDILHTIPPEKRDLFLRVRHTDIKYRFFSDSITVYQCLRTDRILVPMGAVFGMLGACGLAQLQSVIVGHPIRGGIEVGLGIEIGDSDLFGHTLAEAYRIESKVARNPRLVVGKRLMHWIVQSSRAMGNDEASELNQKLASLCRSMVTIDTDGVPVLDYLGQEFMKQDSQGVAQEAYAASIKVINDRLARFQGSSESIYAKWKYLSDYFLGRASLWKQ